MTYAELRTKLNWPKTRMAKLIGMQYQTYHRLESRATMTTSNRALLNALVFLHVIGQLEAYERDVLMRRG